MSRDLRRILLCTLAALIPCILGAAGMIREGVPAGIWAQNPACIAAFALAAAAASGFGVRLHARAAVLASALLLGATLLGPGTDGVRRWIRLPAFTLNAAAAVLPVCIAALARLAGERRAAFVCAGTAGIALLLCLQPDASQLTAFSLPMILLIAGADLPKALKRGEAGLLLLLTALSWLRRDALPPVGYVEGILEILRGQSAALYIAGIAALLGVPASLAAAGAGGGGRTAAAIALYYLLAVLAPFAGNYPVPFMGYGVSPILGLYILLAATGRPQGRPAGQRRARRG